MSDGPDRPQPPSEPPGGDTTPVEPERPTAALTSEVPDPNLRGGAVYPGRMSGVGRIWGVLAIPVISIVLALIVGAVVILLAEVIVPNHPFDPLLPLKAYYWLFQGAFGSVEAIVDTLAFTTPLILGGLAVALGFKGGLFNIGVRGQFLMGALAACWIGVNMSASTPVLAVTAAVIAGMAGGAVWGFIPGALKAFTGAHEVVTTIMLNYIAVGILAAVVSGPLKAPGAQNPVTSDVGNSALPVLVGRDGHIGIIIAVVAAFLVWFLLYRTTLGFEIRTAGANPDASRYAGMRPARLIILTMSLSGMLGGLAGAGQLLGISHQLTGGYDTTVGFDAIAVALLARSNPLAIIFSAFLFGAMRAGAGLMQIEAGIPPELVDVLQGIILLFLVANPVLRRVFGLRRAHGAVDDTETITRTYSGQAAVR